MCSPISIELHACVLITLCVWDDFCFASITQACEHEGHIGEYGTIIGALNSSRNNAPHCKPDAGQGGEQRHYGNQTQHTMEDEHHGAL